MRQFLVKLITLTVMSAFPAAADHNLREIQRRCEVEWDVYGSLERNDVGEIDCRSSVSDRRNIERRCEAVWNYSDGEIECRGSHYRDIERRCEVDRRGNIDC